jgi:transposase
MRRLCTNASRTSDCASLGRTTPRTSIPKLWNGSLTTRALSFHFIPTSASWLNAVEGLFATLTKRRLKRGVFRSIQELKHAIHSFIADTNAKPKPFIWTKDPDKIIAAAKRGHQVLDSIH